MDRPPVNGEDFRDDHLELFPTFARHFPATDEWRIHVRGRVVAPRPDNVRRRLILKMIRRVLKATPEEINSPIFLDRVNGFLMLSRRRRKIRLRFGDRILELRRRTGQSGYFRGAVRIKASEIDSCAVANQSPIEKDAWCTFRGITNKGHQAVHGAVQIIDRYGPSVISDIDDTIKESGVTKRRALIRNTFFEPFREVDGMADLYQQWHHQGVAFHYVSSSPWQLYRPLARFMKEAGFPLGSFHLRFIRLRDPSVLQLFVNTKRSKRKAIKSILRSFPLRQFVLVGDLGEKDPEIYGRIARSYGSQIVSICFRRLKDQTVDDARLKRAMRDVPSDKWRVFDDPAELADLRPERLRGWKIAQPATT